LTIASILFLLFGFQRYLFLKKYDILEEKQMQANVHKEYFMPAIYAHMRFGEAVIKDLPPTFQEKVNEFFPAFLLGTQGPDILFYHKPLQSNPIKKKGMDIHLQPACEFFIEQAKRLIEENHVHPQDGAYLPIDAQAAYIAGFLCHFVLDVSAHPKIYALEETGISHGRIESEFDKYLMRKDGKSIRGDNNAKRITPNFGVAEACANVLDVTKQEAKRAIKTIKTINGWFCSKCEPFHSLAHVVLRWIKMENKFGGMFLHKEDEPHCAECNRDLEALFSNAVPKAAALINEYFANLDDIAKNEKINDFFEYKYTGGKD